MLFVKSMEPMARFYGETLELRSLPCDDDPEDFRIFDAGGTQLALHAIPEPWASGIEIGDPPEAREGAAAKVVFRCSDLKRAREALVSRGVQLGPIHVSGPLSLCDGIDPEGNVFQLSNRI